MRPEQEDQVRANLRQLRLQPQEQQKILNALRAPDNSTGAEAADLIGRGHLQTTPGYSKVLAQLKDRGMQPAAMMSLRQGTDLYDQGEQGVLFERQEQPGQAPFDIDVGTTRADGSFSSGYQLKDVQRVASLNRAATKAIPQLVNAPTNRRVVIMDVHEPSTALDTRMQGILTRRFANENMTLHLRFLDGQDLTLPAGAPTDPEQQGGRP